MREILFRGRRVDTEEWVFGYLREIFGEEFPRFTIAPSKSFESCGWIDLEEAQVIPKTIGEFCGIKDRNGKPIFEGDRIQFVYMCAGKLMQNHSLFTCVHVGTAFRFERDSDKEKFFLASDSIEVIGTIHDEVKG